MSYILLLLITLVNANFVFLVGFNSYISALILLLSLSFLFLRPSYLERAVIRLPPSVLFAFVLLFTTIFLQDIIIHTSFSYSFKILQVVALFPAVLIIFSDLFSGSRYYFSLLFLILSALISSIFRIVYIGSSISGCLFCLENYTYGMRSMLGLNLSGNACLSLLLSASVLFDFLISNKSFIPSPKSSFFLSILYIISVLFSFYIPSRQLFLSISLFIVIMHYDMIISFCRQCLIYFLNLKFKISFLPILLILFGLSCLLTIVVSSEFFNVFIQRSSEIFEQSTSFIRFQQLSIGFNLASDAIFYGHDSKTILIALSGVGTTVFENSFFDLSVKYGLLSLIIVFFILFMLIFSVRNSQTNYTLKVIFPLLLCSFFNEILLETPFWIPIFFAYLLDVRSISRVKR